MVPGRKEWIIIGKESVGFLYRQYPGDLPVREKRSSGQRKKMVHRKTDYKISPQNLIPLFFLHAMHSISDSIEEVVIWLSSTTPKTKSEKSDNEKI